MTKENVVLTSEQRDILKGYKQEVFEALADEETAKEAFKVQVDLAAEATGLKKAFVGKFFKAQFNSKVDDILEEAERIRFFNE